MKDLVAYGLLIFAALGAIYAVGLIISYFIMPDDLNDDYECYCDRCNK